MALLIEKDFGTPASQSGKTVSMEIDGKDVSVPAGTSVMHAAETAGISIPKLCATDTLEAFGSCRLCLVEIEGRRGTPASCTTPVDDGMKIVTQTDRLQRLRKNTMELYLSDTREDEALVALARDFGLGDIRYTNNKPTQNTDQSNPYFTFDPSACIVCSRCVRACDEIQGTFALAIEGRGAASRVVAGMAERFFDSECVSCGACVEACPTDALVENSILTNGEPDETVLTTCAYCGVGCSFRGELKDGELVRMVPWKDGGANHGHSCVKGRFAYTYATHKDRITKPMIRENTDDPWQEVDWDTALNFAAKRLKDTQDKYGVKSIGGITSSRCTNEEVWLVMKLIRAGFGNNNVDTCARVCHSPTGYGLMQTFGESAGTQNFDSVMQADCILVIRLNPTDAHPVFASQMKRRLRQGANLIVADPRAIDLVRTPHIKANYHLALRPGTNVALINAMSYVIVTEGLIDEDFASGRCDQKSLSAWMDFITDPINSPEAIAPITGVSADSIHAAARLYAKAGNAAIYYGLGVTEHSQGSTMVMAMANLAMITGNIGRPGVGVNPMRGQNNVQGSCDMGSFPHQFSGYRDVSDDTVRALFEDKWGCTLDPVPGFKIPNMFNEAVGGNYKGMYIQGEDVAQSDPNIHHVEAALRNLDILIVQDLFLNETARFAHVFLPGTSSLEKDGTFINAERRINRVRPIMPSPTGKQEWEVTQDLGRAMGYDMGHQSTSEIWDEIAELTPVFANVSFAELDRRGSVQWPFNDDHPDGTEVMHVDEFVRGKGNFVITEYIPTDERTNRKFPLILTTGRILSQYNVGAQTRRTKNNRWAAEDFLEIHPADADAYGVDDGMWVSIKSRKGETSLRANISKRMTPGVVYTTHHPDSGANILTTENSDWATECPEYKVTAVSVAPSNHKSDWQRQYEQTIDESRQIIAEIRRIMFPTAISGDAPATDLQTRVYSLDTTKEGVWHIPAETPVAFVYNRRNYAVMLATPSDMKDFALGFSLSERIVNAPGDIESLEIRHKDKGIELHFKIVADLLDAFDARARRRNLVGTAGCGICGLESADTLLAPLTPVSDTYVDICKSALTTAMQNFAVLQPVNLRTKSVHGAAWVDMKGSIQMVREDVGRHNALDKLIGAMRFANTKPDGFLLMSSRCSYEIIDKAARAGIPAILSLSGPTHLALQKARQANMTIYARDKTGGVKRVG